MNSMTRHRERKQRSHTNPSSPTTIDNSNPVGRIADLTHIPAYRWNPDTEQYEHLGGPMIAGIDEAPCRGHRTRQNSSTEHDLYMYEQDINHQKVTHQ